MKVLDRQPKPRKASRSVTVTPMCVDVASSMPLKVMMHVREFTTSWIVVCQPAPIRRFVMDEVPFGPAAFGHLIVFSSMQVEVER